MICRSHLFQPNLLVALNQLHHSALVEDVLVVPTVARRCLHREALLVASAHDFVHAPHGALPDRLQGLVVAHLFSPPDLECTLEKPADLLLSLERLNLQACP